MSNDGNLFFNVVNTAANVASAQASSAIYEEMQTARIVEESKEKAIFWLKDKSNHFDTYSNELQVLYSYLFMIHTQSGRWQEHWFANDYEIYTNFRNKAQETIEEYQQYKQGDWSDYILRWTALIESQGLVSRCAEEYVQKYRDELSKRKSELNSIEGSTTFNVIMVIALLLFPLAWWMFGFWISIGVSIGVMVLGYLAFKTKIDEDHQESEKRFEEEAGLALPKGKELRSLIDGAEKRFNDYGKVLDVLLKRYKDQTPAECRESTYQAWTNLCQAINRDYKTVTNKEWTPGDIATFVNLEMRDDNITYKDIGFPVDMSGVDTNLISTPLCKTLIPVISKSLSGGERVVQQLS